jgi:tRNA(Ile)-lysidine synthase
LNFKIRDFQKQVSAIKKRLAREAVHELKGNLRSITTVHIRQILDLFSRARVGSRLKLPGNIIVVCGYDTVSFFFSDKLEWAEACTSEMDQESIRLKIPGETSLFEGRLQIYTEFAEPPITFSTPINTMQAYLDFDKTGEVIHARFFQPGDHFVPLGMRGHKKLKSYFIDRKIPRERRSNIPILTNAEDDIIWVYGERISDRFRVTNSTKKVLIIEGKGL